MKKIQLSFGMLAVLAGLTAAFAFKAPAPVKNGTALVWYDFNGGDQSNPNNYTKISGTPSCNSDGALCAIEGEDTGTTHPSQATVDSPDDSRFLPSK
ncbi:MAG: hypothetical protein ACTHJ8_11495 [Mucilaginibacter sp.]